MFMAGKDEATRSRVAGCPPDPTAKMAVLRFDFVLGTLSLCC